MQPAPQRSVRGDRGARGDPSQFDPDAHRPPAGMPAAEIQDRLQERRVGAGGPAAVVIARGQIDQGPLIGLCLQGSPAQVTNRADR
jgi:hypothetical protein